MPPPMGLPDIMPMPPPMGLAGMPKRYKINPVGSSEPCGFKPSEGLMGRKKRHINNSAMCT